MSRRETHYIDVGSVVVNPADDDSVQLEIKRPPRDGGKKAFIGDLCYAITKELGMPAPWAVALQEMVLTEDIRNVMIGGLHEQMVLAKMDLPEQKGETK